jgi:hypothetical protein
MANALYDRGRESFLRGELAWQTHEFRAILIDVADYVVALATHQFLSDIPGLARVAVSPAMAGMTTAAGVADANDVTWTAVTGDPSEAVVIYQHALTVGGTALVETAARLVAYIDTATGLPVTPNGGDIIVAWDNGTNRIFKL